MKTKVQPPYSNTNFSLYQETPLNLTFEVGEKVSFYTELLRSDLEGIILKKYTNSCLIDISTNFQLPEKDLEKFNFKLVINYQGIQR